MKKTGYHLNHHSFLTPLFQKLEVSGVSVDRLTSKSNIRRFDLSNDATYLPLNVVYEFLGQVKVDQAIKNIATEFYADFDLRSLGGYGELIMESPDLLTVIHEGIKYDYLFQTNSKMQIEINGPVAKFSSSHTAFFENGKEMYEQITYALITQAFKQILGKDWAPLKIEVPDSSANYLEEIINAADVPIEYGCKRFALIFETKLLSTKVKSVPSKRSLMDHNFESFSEAIHTLLLSMKDGYLPTLTDFSTYFGVSERTIVRSLEKEGIHYSSLLYRFLFNKSIKLIENENLNINEIAQKLGYSNSPNFLRAFKRWTNTTPNAYRLLKSRVKEKNSFSRQSVTVH